MTELTLLTICGALRAASTNRQLLAEARRRFGPANHSDANLHLPLYDRDLEDIGLPPGVQILADQIAQADAVVISTPEYNKALSGVLKNALDWVSRTKGSPWRDKPVAILSAAAGRAGGDRAQFSLRLCLVAFRPILLPGPEVMLGASAEGFDAEGHLKDPATIKALQELMDLLRATAQAR